MQGFPKQTFGSIEILARSCSLVMIRRLASTRVMNSHIRAIEFE